MKHETEPSIPAAPAANPNQALWEKGDFTAIASFMRESGDALVESLGVRPPLHVLDLGCGDGTTALPLALRGAQVRGVDIARNLVAAGRRRAAAADLADRLGFEYGDACCLAQLPDQTFDLTLSIFGAMFAPRPLDVAREMVRVTKRGGRIVMGNWIPNDTDSFVSQLLRISSAYTPPPPAGFVSPMGWGDERLVADRFAAAGVPREQIAFHRDRFTFHCPGDVGHFVDAFRRFYGPTMNAYAAAEKDGRAEELHRELLALAASQARQTGSGIAVSATFLRVIVDC
ncbi:MAG: class I SAM-dependent methyltransferase [Opitutae bacterium]|nr:class I SAM-dependent methyltransferase [Opitutae bacterium]